MGRNKKTTSNEFPWKEILGFLGVVITAYVGYLGIRSQTEIPITATQTAESMSTSTQQMPASTNTPHIVDMPAITPASLDAISNWESQFDIAYGWHECGAPVVLPEYIDPEQSVSSASSQIAQAMESEETTFWQVTPFHPDFKLGERIKNGRFYPSFSISSKPENTAWAKIEKTENINITSRNDVPEHQNIITLPSGCGGGGDIREFPSINLKSDFISYQEKTTLPDVDYISLEPGEFEEFEFEFICNAPGIYNIQINIPYTYLGQSNNINLPSPMEFVCPKSFTWWKASGDMFGKNIDGITKAGEYRWDGTQYKTTQSVNTSTGFLCSQAPKARLKIGDNAKTAPGTPTRLRSKPEAGDNIIASLGAGAKMKIIGGPICYKRPARNDSYVYWKVLVLSSSEEGWIAEGDSESYYIEPIP
jgi:hypothetical protein